ncbi:hypothetical protein [Dongia sp.]|uniref:hypothetical protein n=1 Tax=Dongia sp. TaxID=1977262 RepID=UPI0035AF9E9D
MIETKPSSRPDQRAADMANIADLRLSFTDSTPAAEIVIEVVPVWGGIKRIQVDARRAREIAYRLDAMLRILQDR